MLFLVRPAPQLNFSTEIPLISSCALHQSGARARAQPFRMRHLYALWPPYLNNSHKAQSPFSFYEPPVAVQGSSSLFILQSPSCALIPAFLNFAFCCSLRKRLSSRPVFHNKLWRFPEDPAAEDYRLPL